MKTDYLKPNLLEGGKITRWPKKVVDKKSVLKYISTKIPMGQIFSEMDINEIIIKNISFEDHVLIRREMVVKGFLRRTNDCREYWRATENDIE